MSDHISVAFDAPHRDGAPSAARRAVQALLGDDVPIAVIRDAILLTSELVTNAILHAPGPCRLHARLDRERHVLRVTVIDTSTSLPYVLPVPRSSGRGGRGLLIVNDVAAAWGSVVRCGVKAVWFELATDEAGR